MTAAVRVLPLAGLLLLLMAPGRSHATAAQPAPAVAFLSAREDANYDLYVMNANGENVSRLTNAPGAESDIAWSPGGGKIAFVTQRHVGNPVLCNFSSCNEEIYVIDVDGSNETRLTNNNSDEWNPLWSPDGGSILFSTDRDGNHELYLVHSDGAGPTNLSQNPGSDHRPAWSPDGQKIAFTSDRDGDREIYVMNPDGSGLEQLTTNDADDCCPAWSPDGSKIAFETYRDEIDPDCGFWCNSEIYVMNADGSSQTNLTMSVGADFGPVWSPDGSTIAFQTTRNEDDPESCTLVCNVDVYSVQADGSGETNLTNDSGSDTGPAWSPDGSEIIFTSTRDEPDALLCIFPDCNTEVYRMDRDGAGQAPLTSDPRADCCAVWRPAVVPGDADCDGDADSVDALQVLRDVAQLPSSACVMSGNVKCDDALTATDSLFILRFVALLPVNLPQGCPPIGT